MGALDGRVAIITGAGRGLGREHALLFASEGAKVVVNDLGGDMHGEGGDPSAAMEVVGGDQGHGRRSGGQRRQRRRLGRRRTAREPGGRRTFGDLHILVNNAGILRDRVIINMTEAEWDAVVAVHLKGHFCPTRHAAAYWREQTKAGKTVNAADRPHHLDLGAVREPGPGELRRGQVGHRDLLAGVREGTRALRRPIERDRPRGAARG